MTCRAGESELELSDRRSRKFAAVPLRNPRRAAAGGETPGEVGDCSSTRNASRAVFESRSSQTSARRQHIDPSPGVDAEGEEEDLRGRYLQGRKLKKVMQHIKENLAYTLPQEAEESEDFFLQYQRREP
ncbi:hypothetical protein NDU88_005996 [Pleurodeles waltl]|uniref:Uncharacterized protein n=1 Tax=Pleurodeles waltl TaxID=8319 RepID=A0AAV7TX06_PLEWA|nr:hypothetical protein NDU88_005996 [Pleurodeles waltl]